MVSLPVDSDGINQVHLPTFKDCTISTIVMYSNWLSPLSAILSISVFHSTTFWWQTLYLLPDTYLITLVALQITCCIKAEVAHFLMNFFHQHWIKNWF